MIPCRNENCPCVFGTGRGERNHSIRSEGRLRRGTPTVLIRLTWYLLEWFRSAPPAQPPQPAPPPPPAQLAPPPQPPQLAPPPALAAATPPPILCIQVDEKSKRLVTGSFDKTIRIWNMESQECLKILKGHTDSVRGVQFDESKIVSGSNDGTVKIWDFKKFKCIKTLHAELGKVLSVHFLDNILAAGYEGGIKVWDLKDFNSFELKGHYHRITCVQVVNINLVLSSSWDKTVKLWNLNTRTAIQSIDVGSAAVKFKLLLPFVKNSNEWTSLPPGKLITGCMDRNIKVYDTMSGDLSYTLYKHSSAPYWVDADDSKIVALHRDGTLIEWDINTDQVRCASKYPDLEGLNCMYVTKSGIWLGVGPNIKYLNTIF